MDLEEAFRERCSQCAAVSRGLTDEGKYYCTSCHNVTERSREVIDTGAIPNTKIQAINRVLKRKRKLEKGWDWYVCEGFQHILYQQAEALQSLGVSPELKNEVLHNFWKRYLQKSKQAYCKNPVYTRRRKSTVLEDNSSHSDWESEPELLSDVSRQSFGESGAESQPDVRTPKPFPVVKASHSETTSVCSGSLDGVEYSLRKEKGVMKMSVPRTLAFCYLSLLWQRETITLSDLLRFVEEEHIPYIYAFQHFPEEMKLYGRDKGIFAIESWPNYEVIFKKIIEVATFLHLQHFPDITENCYLHPNILCMKYLMEVNLPNEMHNLTCLVIEATGIGEADFLGFDPIAKKAKTVKYDVQAVAVIVFDFRKWYQVMKKAVDEKKQKWEEAWAKFLWKGEKPLYYSAIDRPVVYKRREMVVSLQKQFTTLPSSFHFNWTEEDSEKPCFHGHSLQGVLQQKGQSLTTKNSLYWLSTQKFCKKSNFSLSYQFILNLFSFLLTIKTSFLHEEVSLIEKRLFKAKYNNKTNKKSSRSRKARKY
ncbi:hypothetical protein FD755_006410 [Muntiacus reevesi]|uniref:TATA box-binding protein-associated factor RNA polymerase I subunit B n=1 Tax=Muntiacus reevesi TaxID=9886 RepID=A0A5J5N1Q4_MUNRE|nr:hypothetical protein FD755_006410 [Muntiacus reevesi]